MAIARCDLPAPVPPISTALRCSVRKAPLARSRISASSIGVPVKSKSLMSLASGSLAVVSCYLIERAQTPGRKCRHYKNENALSTERTDARTFFGRSDPTRVPRLCCGAGREAPQDLLANYANYYNGVRTQLALDKDTPLHRPT
jgi:hypothetical protein